MSLNPFTTITGGGKYDQIWRVKRGKCIPGTWYSFLVCVCTVFVGHTGRSYEYQVSTMPLRKTMHCVSVQKPKIWVLIPSVCPHTNQECSPKGSRRGCKKHPHLVQIIDAHFVAMIWIFQGTDKIDQLFPDLAWFLAHHAARTGPALIFRIIYTSVWYIHP